MVPFAGITGLMYHVCMIAPLVRGDFLKMLLTSSIVMGVTLIMGSQIAPEVTELIARQGMAMPEGAAMATFLANPITWALVSLAKLF
jgi:PTS system galactitol-specific IIC component